MQGRDVMTRGVITVGPDTSVKYAAEVMAERGFAALPVVDEAGQLVGILAEADGLRDRMPQDPRLHARRDPDIPDATPALFVRGVMSSRVRSVGATADLADVVFPEVEERALRALATTVGGVVGVRTLSAEPVAARDVTA